MFISVFYCVNKIIQISPQSSTQLLSLKMYLILKSKGQDRKLEPWSARFILWPSASHCRANPDSLEVKCIFPLTSVEPRC